MGTMLVGVEETGGKLAERVVEFDSETWCESAQNAIEMNSFSKAVKSGISIAGRHQAVSCTVEVAKLPSASVPVTDIVYSWPLWIVYPPSGLISSAGFPFGLYRFDGENVTDLSPTMLPLEPPSRIS